MLPELSAVGTVLMVDINATDADSGANAQITYSIANDDTGSFHIDSITGRFLKFMFRPPQILYYFLCSLNSLLIYKFEVIIFKKKYANKEIPEKILKMYWFVPCEYDFFFYRSHIFLN